MADFLMFDRFDCDVAHILYRRGRAFAGFIQRRARLIVRRRDAARGLRSRVGAAVARRETETFGSVISSNVWNLRRPL